MRSRRRRAGPGDAFVLKLNANGTQLLYSTYLGGIANDSGSAIALDSAGNAYIVGTTFSADFPVKNPFQAAKGAQQDAFVAKINPTGTGWVYSTYLGGNNVDEGNGIAVDAAGNAYLDRLYGVDELSDASPFRGSNAGLIDAFVTQTESRGFRAGLFHLPGRSG